MNVDIFKNYELQREELLARIAQELELDKTRKEKMETTYNAVSDVLKKDNEFFKDLDIVVYPQGSVRIGTTVKPINNDDFDLDTVLHIYDRYSNHTPTEIFNALVRVLKGNGNYSDIMEEKDRCVRINYKGDFHMDILPACMQELYDNEKIAIPERDLNSWSSGNPKGFANRFLQKANSVKKSMLKAFSETFIKAQVDTEPLPSEVYEKTPLQRAVQLVKRYRDIYFENKKYPVSSIVLTTIISENYNGEESIFDTITNTIATIKNNYNNAVLSGKRFKIFNPVDENEEFTDSWTDENYKNFIAFITDFYTKWETLKESFETSGKNYIELFGEGIYKSSLQSQIKRYSHLSSNCFTKANGIILGGSAYTNSKGQINTNQGVKNESYHNFGNL